MHVPVTASPEVKRQLCLIKEGLLQTSFDPIASIPEYQYWFLLSNLCRYAFSPVVAAIEAQKMGLNYLQVTMKVMIWRMMSS
jgi:hypothetical protein